MQTAAAVVATSYGSRRALPRTRSDGLLCLSGSYSRVLQGQKLPTGLRVLSIRFARSRPESRPAAFGHFPPPGCFAPMPAVLSAQRGSEKRTYVKGRLSDAPDDLGVVQATAEPALLTLSG